MRALRLAWKRELSETQRRYLDLYYRRAMTTYAIAEACGVSQPTVSRTLTRARNRLRHVLQYYIM